MADRIDLFYRAQRLLRYGTTELARAFGVSTRTVNRWQAYGGPPEDALHKLAVLVHELDPDLAVALALEGRTTLAALGVASAPRASGAHVDLVVCAAADALDISPRAVRPAVLAAFKRAVAVGLDAKAVVAALEPSARGAKATS